MDRRAFLTRLGIGGAAAVTTQLWLPPVSTALAQPERRVFVPPRGGWRGNETALEILRRYDELSSAEDVANWRSWALNRQTTGGYQVLPDIADEILRVIQGDAALKKIVLSMYVTPRTFTMSGYYA